MAAMMTAAPIAIRASTSPASARKARGVSSRVVAPKALRRGAVSSGRRSQSLVVSERRRIAAESRGPTKPDPTRPVPALSAARAADTRAPDGARNLSRKRGASTTTTYIFFGHIANFRSNS